MEVNSRSKLEWVNELGNEFEDETILGGKCL